MIAPVSWLYEARVLGYTSEQSMLHDLYIRVGLSIDTISNKIQKSKSGVWNRLHHYKIPLRSRGGDFRSGTLRVQIAQEDLHTLSVISLIRKYGVSRSAVFHQRRTR